MRRALKPQGIWMEPVEGIALRSRERKGMPGPTTGPAASFFPSSSGPRKVVQPSGIGPGENSIRSSGPASIFPIPSQAKAPAAMPSLASIRTFRPFRSFESQELSMSASFAGAIVLRRMAPLAASMRAMKFLPWPPPS